MIKYLLNGKARIILLTVVLSKNIVSICEWIYSIIETFGGKCESWIKFILLCNKSRFKNPTGVNAIKTTELQNYDTKISEIEKKTVDRDHNNKYITTQEFKRLTAQNFATRLNEANLATIADIDNFVEKTDFDDKLKNLYKRLLQMK